MLKDVLGQKLEPGQVILHARHHLSSSVCLEFAVVREVCPKFLRVDVVETAYSRQLKRHHEYRRTIYKIMKHVLVLAMTEDELQEAFHMKETNVQHPEHPSEPDC